MKDRKAHALVSFDSWAMEIAITFPKTHATLTNDEIRAIFGHIMARMNATIQSSVNID